MDRNDFDQLLLRPEASDLDWKAALPKGLHGISRDEGWEGGRAELLRDLVAIANTVSASTGYLVYGVKDLGASRRVVGVTKMLDDADLQQWSENHFEPPPRFEYSTLTADGHTVALLEIFPDQGRPHAVARELGGILHEGQVWFRRGTKNTVARRDDLARLFGPREPLRARGNSPLVDAIARYYHEQGFKTRLVRYLEKDGRAPEGWEVALDPRTGREIWIGGSAEKPELIMMKKAGNPNSANGA